ncbi:glyoxalase [Dyella psychrodurans]|nr:glyoxalase [Dyella psychrodurans]
MITRSLNAGVRMAAIVAIAWSVSALAPLSAKEAATQGVSVGPQYDTTHVYIAPADFDAFVNSFTATFGGKPSKRGTFNVMPVPANTQAQYVWTPIGTLSTFAFLTPIPYPFGQERTGYLVTDMDQAIKEARAAGAEVIVDKFKDPIGLDAVIQWPGGVKMQLYWHFTAPHYDPLQTVPDNRVYVSADTADTFVRDFVRFSHGKVVSDDRKADAGEIGKSGQTYRRIRIESGFGKMQVNVTDGQLPYPFGYEISGYEVSDLDATLAKATAAGAKVLSPRFDSADRSSAMVQFPGGYIAEIHALKAH